MYCILLLIFTQKPEQFLADFAIIARVFSIPSISAMRDSPDISSAKAK